MYENVHSIEKDLKHKRGFSHPLFSYGFRPFFLLASLQAIFSIFIWVYSLNSNNKVIAWGNPSMWHGHEMIFGFAMAVIAGFLLTAVPKWTGTKHLKGTPILVLAALWLLGRFSMFNIFPPVFSAVFDISFIPAVILTLILPIIRAKKIRNIAFLILLSLLTIANIFIHLQQLEMVDYGYQALLISIFIVLQMIVIVGGRVIPMFTKNALIHEGISVKYKNFEAINYLAISSLPTLLILGLAFEFDNIAVRFLSVLFSVIHLVRLILLKGYKAYKIPIVWILHIGYLWIPASLILLAVFGLNTALHAFTAGTIGTMILAMMSRVSLGHTGRKIFANRTTVSSYIMLQIAVITRLLAPFGIYYQELIAISGLLWGIAFTCFLVAYAPILFKSSK